MRGNERKKRGKNAEVLDGPWIGMHRRNNMIKMLSSAKDTFILIYILSDLSIIECIEMYFSSKFFETSSLSAETFQLVFKHKGIPFSEVRNIHNYQTSHTKV